MINAYIFTFIFMVSHKCLTVTPVKQPKIACYGRAKEDNLIGGYRAKTQLSKTWYSAISKP